MRLLLLLFGGALIAAGAAAMLYGTDNVLSERGWSALISGATVFAAGAVVIALAAVIAKLDQVAGALHAARGNSPAYSEIAAAAPIAAAVVTEAVLHAVPGREDEASDPAPVLLPVEAPEGDRHRAVSSGHGDVADLAVAANHVDAHEDRPAAAPAERSAETSFDWLERALAADEGSAARPQPESPLAGADSSAPVPLSKSELPPAPSEPEPAGEREELFVQADRLSTPLVAASQGEDAPRPQRWEPPAAPVASDGLAPPAADPAILGRYQANGNSYVMFSDGSIEAVTQTGVYHFKSMAELKAFIEAQA
jgi:hypothetical protein